MLWTRDAELTRSPATRPSAVAARLTAASPVSTPARADKPGAAFAAEREPRLVGYAAGRARSGECRPAAAAELPPDGVVGAARCTVHLRPPFTPCQHGTAGTACWRGERPLRSADRARPR